MRRLSIIDIGGDINLLPMKIGVFGLAVMVRFTTIGNCGTSWRPRGTFFRQIQIQSGASDERG